MSFLSKPGAKGKIAITCLLVIALFFLARATGGERGDLSFVETILRDITAPFKSGAMFVYDKVSGIPEFFTSRNALKEQIAELEQKNEELQLEVNRLTEAAIENTRLRQLLNLQEELAASWDPVATKVIAYHDESNRQTVTINSGEKDGLQIGQAVVAKEGMVGRITAVSSNTAEVLLILDKEGTVAALEQASRTPGVVEGAGLGKQELYMLHIPYDAPIAKNRTVVSSGLTDTYPAGLRIGYITNIEVESGGLMLKATLRPFVDFDRLEEVIVLKPRGGNAES